MSRSKIEDLVLWAGAGLLFFFNRYAPNVIIEAKKKSTIDRRIFKSMNLSKKNYNRYGQSLMKDKAFQKKVKVLSEISKKTDKLLEEE